MHAVIFMVLLFADQITKIVIDGGNVNNEIIKGFLTFQNVHNDGAAFSFLGDKPWAQTFFIVLTAVALVAFFAFYLFADERKKTLRLSLVLIMCGAMGNFIDRIAFSYVRDFIHFHFFPATFNIADAALCVGAALFIVHYLFLDADAIIRTKASRRAAAAKDGCADEHTSVKDGGADAHTSEMPAERADTTDNGAYDRASGAENGEEEGKT